MILAIDTSTGVSVALHNGEKLIAETNIAEHGIQGEMAVAVIAELLEAANLTVADLTKIVVGVGPGPFTGLRVGLTSAHVLANALQIEIVGICSLAGVAHDFGAACTVVTNARRKELYWAQYSLSGDQLTEPQVTKPDQVPTNLPIVGPAATLYPEVVSGQVLSLRAGALADLVASGRAKVELVSPMYLRAPDAVEPTTRKSVL